MKSDQSEEVENWESGKNGDGGNTKKKNENTCRDVEIQRGQSYAH